MAVVAVAGSKPGDEILQFVMGDAGHLVVPEPEDSGLVGGLGGLVLHHHCWPPEVVVPGPHEGPVVKGVVPYHHLLLLLLFLLGLDEDGAGGLGACEKVCIIYVISET